MLELWLSTDRKVNTSRLLTELCTRAEKGEDGLYLLVPEQFSHSMERTLCRYGGDSISLHAEVLSFSRLANRVFSLVGGIADGETDAAGRLLMMSLAVEQVRSRLKIYGSSVSRPEFLLQLLDMFDEFRGFCVTPERLRQAAASMSGTLAVKTEEFALLMESLDAVSAHLGQTPDSKLTRLCAALENSDFAAGKCFFFDGFTDFNGIETEIIAQLLNGGARVSVCLQCDGLSDGGQQFEAARETARSLLNRARLQNEEVKIHTLPAEENGQPLPYLRKHLFTGGGAPYSGEQEALRFLRSPDKEHECRIVAGEILRLVSEGARWRDISIACADFAEYRPVLESVLTRSAIPAYFAGDTDILRQSVVHMLLSALEAASGAMETEDVLAYIKSGYVPLEREQCDRLENYILLWNISGKRWEQTWSMNPGGFRKKPDATTAGELKLLNEARERVIGPLVKLRAALRSAKTTGEMVLGFYAFMQDICLEDTLRIHAETAQGEGDLQQAQEYTQVYALLTGLMEQIYGVLGASVRSPEDFCRIFRTALSQCSVGTIPASLDCVSVGSLLSQRRCDTDYVFLLGVREESFPSAKTAKSLLTDSERKDFMRLGIGVAPTAAGRLNRELAAIDSVLNAPQKRLYLSAVSGTEAYLYRRAQALFPMAETCSCEEEIICRARREYLSYLTAANTAVRAAAPENLRQEAQRLAETKDYVPGRLSGGAVRRLYGGKLRLSSSKIDKLASCRFAYFLEYGLRARERETAEVDASLYGTFVHDVLEHTARTVQNEGGFHAVSLDRALEIAEARMEEYAERELAELWESARAEQLFRRNFAEVRKVVTELYRELSASEFIPRWFELHFAENGALPAVRILGEKAVAELEGYVDRADIWRCGDRVYVRVVDYKTGKKSFDYTSIFNGLGLQMLLYLFALRQTGSALLQTPLEPAGVLYFPARAEKITVKDKMDAKTRESKHRLSIRRSGLILDSEPVLQAMEPCTGQPVYMPYTYDKNGERKGDLFTPEQLNRLESFVFSTVAALGDELCSGNVEPNPYFKDQNDNACAWCPYTTVCRGGGTERWLKKVRTPNEFWQRIGEVEDNG